MVILSMSEAAKLLGKTKAALSNGYSRWGVPHFRLGGQIKFTQEALTNWVEKSMITKPGDARDTVPITDGRGLHHKRRPTTAAAVA